jgi:hypothetical protein
MADAVNRPINLHGSFHPSFDPSMQGRGRGFETGAKKIAPIGTRRLFCYDPAMPVVINDNPKAPAHREGA